MKRLALAALVFGSVAAASSMPALQCRLEVAPHALLGEPVALHFSLGHTGPQAVWVLRWNSPWEGRWMAPFATVSRDGQALAYQGPMVKRAAPDAASYLRLAPGETLQVVLPLAPAFDLGQAGTYRLQPAIVLGDVQLQQGSDGPRLEVPRRAVGLDCPEARFTLLPRP